MPQSKLPAKCHLRNVPDDFWKKVKHYKVEHPEYKTASDVVLHLAQIGLQTEAKR